MVEVHKRWTHVHLCFKEKGSHAKFPSQNKYVTKQREENVDKWEKLGGSGRHGAMRTWPKQ